MSDIFKAKSIDHKVEFEKPASPPKKLSLDFSTQYEI